MPIAWAMRRMVTDSGPLFSSRRRAVRRIRCSVDRLDAIAPLLYSVRRVSIRCKGLCGRASGEGPLHWYAGFGSCSGHVGATPKTQVAEPHVSVMKRPRPTGPTGRRGLRFWEILGPGLITGAADDDPSGIATYAQAGTRYGFALAWT